jgi:hypothetical protein
MTPHATMASIRLVIPGIFITRLRLQASACVLIAVLARPMVLARKCGAPSHGLSVPRTGV